MEKHYDEFSTEEIQRRTWNDATAQCRLCGRATDTLSHLAECEIVRSISSAFIKHEDPQEHKLIYSGLLLQDSSPHQGWSAVLHTVIWNFMLIALTRLDTCGDRNKHVLTKYRKEYYADQQ